LLFQKNFIIKINYDFMTSQTRLTGTADMRSISTRFANITPLSAMLMIAALILLIAYGLLVYEPIKRGMSGKPGDSDLTMYRLIVERIQAGDGYYTAAGDELRRMKQASRNVLNWRPPLHAWFLGHLPNINTGRAFAILLTVTTLFIWMTVFHQQCFSFIQVLGGCIILAGPVIYASLADAFFSHEFWAGTLIALSLATCARGWYSASIISGIIALLFRELALPYVCMMLVLSLSDGRRREAFAWLMGIFLFCAGLMFHWSIVNKLVTENDLALKGGWIVFGGWPFVLHTAQMQPFLLMLPTWVTAIYLPLTLLGLAGWRDQLGLRIAATVGVYVVAYLCVGRSFNLYWGQTYAFVAPLGLLYLPYVLRDLWQAVSKR
jgi:hypothetical protein